jgi:hypothetical protein
MSGRNVPPSAAGPKAEAVFKKAMEESANLMCFECSSKMPQWASVNMGIYICLECSGIHRGLGVHLSFVRSLTMDKWDDLQLARMELGGNGKLKRWFKQRGLPADMPISQRYCTPAAATYRDKLKADAEAQLNGGSAAEPTTAKLKHTAAAGAKEELSGAAAASAIGGELLSPASVAAADDEWESNWNDVVSSSSSTGAAGGGSNTKKPVTVKKTIAVTKAARAAAAADAAKSFSGFGGQSSEEEDSGSPHPSSAAPKASSGKASSNAANGSSVRPAAAKGDDDWGWGDWEEDSSKTPSSQRASRSTPTAALTPTSRSSGIDLPFGSQRVVQQQSFQSRSLGSDDRFSAAKGISSSDYFGQPESPPASSSTCDFNNGSGSSSNDIGGLLSGALGKLSVCSCCVCAAPCWRLMAEAYITCVCPSRLSLRSVYLGAPALFKPACPRSRKREWLMLQKTHIIRCQASQSALQ